MALKPVAEPMQERRGLDYATLVYTSSERTSFRRLFGKLIDTIENCFPSAGFFEGGGSPHFERCFLHELGIRLEFTEPDSEFTRNKGNLCLTLPGAFFYLQAESEMADAFCYLTRMKGFSHFTRMDLMNTELEPDVNAEQMLAMVAGGEIWVKGQSTWRPWQEMKADGSVEGGLTIYWGSTRSEKLGRSYDKAKQKPQWALPAVRDEVQTRGKWARSHGEWLLRELTGTKTPAEKLAVMASNATYALSQHLMYYELGNVSPTDKNWLRSAKKADWYVKRIGKETRPIQKAPEEVLDLDRAVEAGIRQFGRTFYRYAHVRGEETGLGAEAIALSLFSRFEACLKREDLSWLAPDASPEDAEEIWQAIERSKDEAALGQERGFWKPWPRESPY